MATDTKKEKPKSDSSRVKSALARLDELKQKKQFWLVHWQALGEYFLTRKSSFTVQRQEGAFLDSELFDGTGADALLKSSSCINSLMWPNGASSFQLERPANMPDEKEINEYYQKAGNNLAEDMDDAKAGLPLAVDEFQIDQIGFGTSGISVMPGKKSVLSFKAENVKFMSIDEGPDGFVDTVFIEMEWELRKVVREYGVDSLHAETRKLWNEGKENEKIEIVFLVWPRMDHDPMKEGKHGMAFESMHIEKKKKHLIKDGGFKEIPIKVGRLRKAMGEIYGRGLADAALPNEQELNAVLEGITICIEKMADPTLVVMEDGVAGSGQIDTSAGSVIVINVPQAAQASNHKVVDTLPTGEVRDAAKLVESLEKKIANAFLLDRLLDFNNEAEMTLGEVNIRNQIRGYLLNSMFGRQICEVFGPLIENSADISFEAGRMGVVDGSKEHKALIAKGYDATEIILIPQKILARMGYKQGQKLQRPPFKIKYISPAARLMQAEQADAIVSLVTYGGQAVAINPAAGDAINFDISLKKLGYLRGAPSECLHSDDEILTVRTAREQAAQQQQELQAAQPVAKAGEHIAKAHQIMQQTRNPGAKKAA